MWRAFLCALVLQTLAWQCQCQYFSEFETTPDDFFRRHYWQWRANVGPGEVWPARPVERIPGRRDVEPTTEKDREPLGPDYRDPSALPDLDELPVAAGSAPDTGVIDVDVNGFPNGFPAAFPDLPDNSEYPSFGNGYPGGFFSFLGSIKRAKPWWSGPNVCIEREETTEDDDNKKEDSDVEEEPTSSFLSSINLSTCSESTDKYECVTRSNNRGIIKTFTIKYKCCYGYKRLRGEAGCVEVELKNLMETVQNVQCNEFSKLITNTGLNKKLAEENLTIFVAMDQALNDFTEKMLEMNQVELEVEPARRKRDLRNALSSRDLVLNHIVPGFVDLGDIENEQTLSSEYKNSTIRLNMYPTASGERLLTANCIPIRKPNNLATNGIVHVIDGVIMPGQYPIKEIIAESKKLTMLSKIFSNPELAKLLDRKTPFTLLAPTDEAFEKLDGRTKDKLLQGDACAINILKYHIIPHSVCSPAISGNVTTHNIEGNLLNIERKEDDTILIEDSVKIEKTDIIATDGVIHLVDSFLLPDSGLPVTQALKKQNLTKFEELIEEAGLAAQLEELTNATLFAPNDEAFSEPETIEALKELKSDSEKLKEVILYHVLPAQMPSCDLNNNEMKKTLADGKMLRVNLYSTLPLFTNVINRGTANCARLVNFDEKSCGSVIHTINKLLIPPTKNILDIVQNTEKYSILKKIIRNTEIERILEDENSSMTLLAPTNEVFEKLKEDDLKMLLENKEKATEILKHHILTEVLCCSGVGSSSFTFDSFVPTLSQHTKEIRRNSRHQIRIGQTTVTQCDTMAKNGVVHEVNKVMLPTKNQYNIPGFGLFLFNFEM